MRVNLPFFSPLSFLAISLSAVAQNHSTKTDSLKTYNSEEVTVTATRARDGAPGAFTVVKQEEIRKRNLGQDVPYLLQNTPSAVATSDAGTGIGYTGFRVRGSDATRTNVTLNGVPVNDAESQGTFWVDLPDLASSVKDIQIQRGIGTSTNGPGAFGASVNIQLQNPSTKPFARVAASAGSFNTNKQTVQAGTGLLPGNIAIEGRASRVYSDGYIDRATSDLNSFMLNATRYGSRVRTSLVYLSGREKTYQAWYGIPQEYLAQGKRKENLAGTDFGQRAAPYDNETDNYRQDYLQLNNNADLGKGWQLGHTLFLTLGKGYYEQYKVNDALSNYGISTINFSKKIISPSGDTVLLDTSINSSDLIRRRWLDNRFYGTTFSLSRQDSLWDFTVGGLATRFDNSSFGEVVWARYAGSSEIRNRYYQSPSTKQEASLFARAGRTLGRMYAFADVQVRAIDYRISGTESGGNMPNLKREFFFLNPKAGLSYRLSEPTQLYAHAGLAHREPNRTALTEARSGMPVAEQMLDVEAGYRRTSRQVQGELNLYYMRYKNQLVLTGELNDVGNSISRNVPNSYRTGVEATLSARPHPTLTLFATATLSQNKISRYEETTPLYSESYEVIKDTLGIYNNADISFSPSAIATGQVRWQPFPTLEIEYTQRFIGRQFLDNTGNKSRSISNYTVGEARIAWQPLIKGLSQLRFTAQVFNILNTKYVSNGYTYFSRIQGQGGYSEQNFNYVFPQAGRWFLAGVEIMINN